MSKKVIVLDKDTLIPYTPGEQVLGTCEDCGHKECAQKIVSGENKWSDEYEDIVFCSRWKPEGGSNG